MEYESLASIQLTKSAPVNPSLSMLTFVDASMALANACSKNAFCVADVSRFSSRYALSASRAPSASAEEEPDFAASFEEVAGASMVEGAEVDASSSVMPGRTEARKTAETIQMMTPRAMPMPPVTLPAVALPSLPRLDAWTPRTMATMPRTIATIGKRTVRMARMPQTSEPMARPLPPDAGCC